MGSLTVPAAWGMNPMNRQNRIALLIAAVLVVAVSGTVLATRRAPSLEGAGAPAASAQDEPEEGAPDASGVAHAADRLSAHGLSVDEAQLAALAGRYGLGGAVRLVAWADETGMTVDEIAAMRDGDGTDGSAMGWGQIAHELGVHPGIGSIMGNGGGNGQGHKDDEGDEPEASGD
jgi:hypothetical protein